MNAHDEAVARGYARGRHLTAVHGRTYHLAAALLPPERRTGVYALYGFARHVDDIVDMAAADTVAGDTLGTVDSSTTLTALDVVERALAATLAGAEADSAVPVDLSEILAALGDTVRRFDIDPSTFDAFLTSMRMDVPGSPVFRCRYRTFDELAEYMYGSAAVIGEQMMPLLGADASSTDVLSGARRLGEAFQLTNFLRDVAEDLDRDRIYLPTGELAAFGVDEAHLRECRRTGTTSPRLRRALAHLIAVNRDHYRAAAPAITRLPARTRPAIAAAASMYAAILTEIEDADHAVMARRLVVPRRRRLALAATAAVGAARRAR